MKRLAIIMTATATIGLAACGDSAADNDAAAIEAEPVVSAEEFDPMTRDYTLSEEQQALRADFDEAAFQDEYRGYRGEVMSEQVRMGDAADPAMDEEERAAAAQSRDPNTNMRMRSNMTWSYLDRNGDGQLSVAEYAIWAIPLDPTAAAPNDETAPYLTSDEANRAADSFFYYDSDGDTYLSQREFTTARSGDMIS